MRSLGNGWNSVLAKLEFRRQQRRGRGAQRNQYARRLGLESLEDRRVLAILTVNSFADTHINTDGVLTLREAIEVVNQGNTNGLDNTTIANQISGSLGDDDTIEFSTDPAHGLNGGTIMLTQGQLTVTESVAINATMLSAGLTIDAGDGTDGEFGTSDGHRIFTIAGGSSGEVEINGLTLTGGDAPFNGGAISASNLSLTVKNTLITENASYYNGGGIAAFGNLRVENCTVTGNSSGIDNGGGIYFGSNSELNVISSTISGNEAGGGGGGIFANGPFASVNIQSSHITGNQSRTVGGGIYFNAKTLRLQSSEVRDNSSATTGGGLWADVSVFATDGSILIDQSNIEMNKSTAYNSLGAGAYLYSNNASVTITNSTISNNQALGIETNIGGLTIRARNNSNVLIDRVKIIGNHADDDTGGLYIDNRASVVTLTNSTISGNTANHNSDFNAAGGVWLRASDGAQTTIEYSTISGNRIITPPGGVNQNVYGGGLFIQQAAGTTTTIRNTTISGNEAEGSGGGIKIAEDPSPAGGVVRILHSTITNNRADSDNDGVGTGGGIHIGNSGTTVTIEHTIIAGNFRGSGSSRDDISGSPTVAATWSLIGDNTGATISNIEGNQIGTASMPIDPYLLPLDDNGGLTMTHALQAFSPARNMGNPSVVPGVDVPQFDQRGAGFLRKVGPRIDIGAYEAASALVCVSMTMDEFDTDLSYGDLSLREAVNYANTAGEPTTICLPTGVYGLSLAGSGGVSQGDLDITGGVTIVGTGAGETVIDASGLVTTSDRIFDIQSGGTLNLSRVTLTGGKAPNVGGGEQHGGAIYVRNGGTLHVNESALVGNQTTYWSGGASGGAIYFAPTGGGTITHSVITANHAAGLAGGVFLASGPSGTQHATVTVTGTVIVNNTADYPPPNEPQTPDVRAALMPSSRSFTSGGNNRLGNATAGLTHDPNGNGDYVKPAGTTVHYVVTGVADSYNHVDDNVVMSLRDAIDLANTTSGAQEIWVPAWSFILTRERTAPSNSPEMDIGQGDLEIKDSLTIRGVNGSTSVAWRAGAAVDKVFELVGDYNSNGSVSTEDYIIWSKQNGMTGPNLAADGDDDGDVDSADLAVRNTYFGNTLMLWGVA